MLQGEEKFFEDWSVFIDNLDTIGYEADYIARDYYYDRDYYLFDEKPLYQYTLTNPYTTKPGRFEFKVSQSILKLMNRLIDSNHYTVLSVAFFGEAIKDKYKLIEYIGLSMPVFTNIFLTLRERIDRMREIVNFKKKMTDEFFLDTVYISNLDKIPALMTFSDYEENSLPANDKFLPSISTFSIKLVKFGVTLYGYINEDFGFDLYYKKIAEEYPIELRKIIKNLEKFPLTLEECVEPKNRKKLISYLIELSR